MNMTVTDLPGPITCVRLEGRLDSPGVERIDLRFTTAVAAVGRPAVVDLCGVTLLTSIGIRLFVTTARALSQKGATMVLFGAQPLVQEGLSHTALEQIIPVVATEAQAIERALA